MGRGWVVIRCMIRGCDLFGEGWMEIALEEGMLGVHVRFLDWLVGWLDNLEYVWGKGNKGDDFIDQV